MDTAFINLTPENLADEHLCCIIRCKKPHPGVEAKRQWLSDRLNEGHVFRKLDAKAAVFIEYAPLETAWVPITGDNFYYIYCLWVLGDYKGKGYGKALMEYCLADAEEKGKSGVEVVDTTDDGYELLSLSCGGPKPSFTQTAKKQEIEDKELTIFYSMQCPYVLQTVEMCKQYGEENNVSISFNKVDSLQKAKELPCVFNNWSLFYKEKFETVNLLDVASLKRILKK